MTKEEEEKVIKVLSRLALSDNMGDVREAEDGLWELLGILPKDVANLINYDSPYEVVKTMCDRLGIKPPY